MACLTSPIQDPLWIVLRSLPILKTLFRLIAKSKPHCPPPAPPRPDSPGRWRSAGAPGRRAAACWRGALSPAAGGGLSPRAACSLQARCSRRGESRAPAPGPAHSAGPAPPPQLAGIRRPIPCDWAGRALVSGSRGPGPACGAGDLPEGPLQAAASFPVVVQVLTGCGTFSQLLNSEVHRDLSQWSI